MDSAVAIVTASGLIANVVFDMFTLTRKSIFTETELEHVQYMWTAGDYNITSLLEDSCVQAVPICPNYC